MRRLDSLNAAQEVAHNQTPLCGEIKLCRAIILQALADVARPQVSVTRKRLRDAAIGWVMSNRTQPFSFRWCVEQGFSEFDAELIIGIIRKNIRGGEDGYLWDRLLRRCSVCRPCD